MKYAAIYYLVILSSCNSIVVVFPVHCTKVYTINMTMEYYIFLKEIFLAITYFDLSKIVKEFNRLCKLSNLLVSVKYLIEEVEVYET